MNDIAKNHILNEMGRLHDLLSEAQKVLAEMASRFGDLRRYAAAQFNSETSDCPPRDNYVAD